MSHVFVGVTLRDQEDKQTWCPVLVRIHASLISAFQQLAEVNLLGALLEDTVQLS